MTTFLTNWSFPPIPFIAITLAAALYLRGFVLARRTRPHQLQNWRAFCFFSGLATLWLALASPIDALDDYLLSVHMIQHFILMSVAPPLIVLGAPTVPILRGLPRPGAIVGPILRNRAFHAALRFLTHPITAWLLMNIAYLGWHTPFMFELTFASDRVHDLEHFCFFSTSLLFWWVVVAPWPSRPRWPRWTVIPYLFSADVVNTVLSAVLTFSTHVLYPSYAAAPRVSFLTPLKDQAAAGAEMWVLNSIVFLIPAVAITLQLLTPRSLRAATQAHELLSSR
ncbi:MAG: cytochrome c oxidase assembly protein [Terracidiphilus sp.]